MPTLEAPIRKHIVITDQERRDNYATWTAYREGDWTYFGIPEGAKVRMRRLENEKATVIEWD